MGQGRLKGPQSMEVHTKLGVLQHPHPSGVIPVTHHANSAQSKTKASEPGRPLRELAGQNG